MEVPYVVWVLLAPAAFALAVFGARGCLELQAALQCGDLAAILPPHRWPVTRGFVAMLAAVPVAAAAAPLGAGRWGAALVAAGLASSTAPRFLASARERVALSLLDELPLQLDLVALALESGSSWAGALSAGVDHAPEGALRRALQRALLDLSAEADPFEALRQVEDRAGFKLFGNLAAALRSAEKFGVPLAPVLREKARHAAASRFARAEHLARTAPLKLWAALLLCIVPCTLVVLAFPLARMLARIAG
jgi:tight adherence protein C